MITIFRYYNCLKYRFLFKFIKANFVDKEKDKNEDYINKIRTNNFFKKKKTGNGMVKLLPGEKMIVKDNHKNIVLDSHALKQQGYLILKL